MSHWGNFSAYIIKLQKVPSTTGWPFRTVKPPVVTVAGGPQLQLPTAWAGWRNILNLSQQEDLLHNSLTLVQGDHSGWWKSPVDLVPTVQVACVSPLWLPTAQAGRRNIPNQSLQGVFYRSEWSHCICFWGSLCRRHMWIWVIPRRGLRWSRGRSSSWADSSRPANKTADTTPLQR